MKTRLRSDGSKRMPASARLSTTSISAITPTSATSSRGSGRYGACGRRHRRHALAASRLALPPAAVVSMQRCRSTA